jgi:hypothetical protein
MFTKQDENETKMRLESPLQNKKKTRQTVETGKSMRQWTKITMLSREEYVKKSGSKPVSVPGFWTKKSASVVYFS